MQSPRFPQYVSAAWTTGAAEVSGQARSSMGMESKVEGTLNGAASAVSRVCTVDDDRLSSLPLARDVLPVMAVQITVPSVLVPVPVGPVVPLVPPVVAW